MIRPGPIEDQNPDYEYQTDKTYCYEYKNAERQAALRLSGQLGLTSLKP